LNKKNLSEQHRIDIQK
jgi:hypothetical protein